MSHQAEYDVLRVVLKYTDSYLCTRPGYTGHFQRLLQYVKQKQVEIHPMSLLWVNERELIQYEKHPTKYATNSLYGVFINGKIYINVSLLISETKDLHPTAGAGVIASVILHELQHFENSLTNIFDDDVLEEASAYQVEHEFLLGTQRPVTRSQSREIQKILDYVPPLNQFGPGEG